MSYEVAIKKAWDELAAANPPKTISVQFLADTYEIDVAGRKVFSLSCNVPAKDFASILILHYATQQLKGLPPLKNEWHTFKELSGIEGYGETYRKRSVEPIIRKYGQNPQALFTVCQRLPAKKINQADAAIVVEAFAGVPVLVELWAGDDEFGPEATMLFDKSIAQIFCTEDIVVLAGMVSASL